MSWGSRILTTWYAVVALAITWTTVLSFGEAPLWFTLTLTAISITPAIAALRETAIADERRLVAVLVERELRRTTTPPAPPPDNGPPLNGAETAAWTLLAARLNLGPDDPRSNAT